MSRETGPPPARGGRYGPPALRGHVDLFTTRDDGSVITTFFEVDGGWRTLTAIGSGMQTGARR